MGKKKLIRSTTIPITLVSFCAGLLRELNKEYEVIALSSPDAQHEETITQREGVRFIGVEIKREISLLSDIKSLWRLWRVFRKEKPDLIHSMTPKAGLLCMIASWLAGVPVRVHTFTGLVFPTAKGMLRQLLMLTDRITCACATHIIPEGNGVLNDLRKYKITRKPLKVLAQGNVRGIDLAKYNPELEELKTIQKEKDTFNFIFIGRIVGDKGINELVEAFVRLHEMQPQTRLTLVGWFEQNLDPVSQKTFDTINNHKAINYVGRQADVRPWLISADCAVLPSYREGFPNVVIEAGAMGLPQIVTDINGANEIIIEGRNGLIVPPRDAEALYQAMKRMVTEPGLAAALAREARQLIADRYEQGYVRQCLKDFYRSILPS